MRVKNSKAARYDQSDCMISPGELVESSGIYEICHADEPRVTVLFLRNTFFPSCRQCGDQVRFRLIQAAPHISEDPDFLEDFPEEDIPSAEVISPTGTFPLQLGVAHGFRFWPQMVPARRDSSDNGNL